MNKETISTLVRTLCKVGGGYLVAKGIIDDASVVELTGAIVTVVAVAWGLYDAKKAKDAKFQAQQAGNFGKQSQCKSAKHRRYCLYGRYCSARNGW